MKPGSLIAGKYRILATLGRGGMGTVFEAEHTGTGARVALKVIHSQEVEPEIVRRFEREARATASIQSQHIVRVFDTGIDETLHCPYLVMERLVGEDLAHLLKRVRGPLPVGIALRVIAQACLGLAKAHAAHVVHRDIKPANLFLAQGDNEGEFVVKVLDFGIAKVKMDFFHDSGELDAFTRTGRMLGSPHYMSPEQAQGLKTVDHRADLWSLGVVLYKCLAGRTPYAELDGFGQVLIAICSQPVKPLQEVAPWVPPHVAAIVHRALAFHVEDRFQSAEEMLAAITPLLADAPSPSASLRLNAMELTPSVPMYAPASAGTPNPVTGSGNQSSLSIHSADILSALPAPRVSGPPSSAPHPTPMGMAMSAGMPMAAVVGGPGAVGPAFAPTMQAVPGMGGVAGMSGMHGMAPVGSVPPGMMPPAMASASFPAVASGAVPMIPMLPGQTGSTLTAAGTSTRAVGPAQPSRERRSSNNIALVMATAALAVAAWLVFKQRDHGAAAAQAAAKAPESAVVASAAPPHVAPPVVSAAPVASAAASAAVVTRTVKIAIAPADAVVDVDGTPTPVKGGSVDLTGPLGSLHSVHVVKGKLETREDVAITARGALPDRLAVSATPSRSGGARRGGGGAMPPVFVFKPPQFGGGGGNDNSGGGGGGGAAPPSGGGSPPDIPPQIPDFSPPSQGDWTKPLGPD